MNSQQKANMLVELDKLCMEDDLEGMISFIGEDEVKEYVKDGDWSRDTCDGDVWGLAGVWSGMNISEDEIPDILQYLPEELHSYFAED